MKRIGVLVPPRAHPAAVRSDPRGATRFRAAPGREARPVATDRAPPLTRAAGAVHSEAMPQVPSVSPSEAESPGGGVPEARRVLRDVFGYEEFRPGQEAVIRTVLAGRDCIAVMPTGAGKSLTYQIPARILGGTALVVSPLISLMKDQVDALGELGFRAAAINSSLDSGAWRERVEGLRAGRYELVYVAPEALEGGLRRAVRESPVSFVAVDEAHCISQWGHDFRPAYRRLAGLKEELRAPVLALTATATRRVARDILGQLGMRQPGGYKGSFFRSNLRIYARRKGSGDTRREILALVRAHAGESGVIYCMSRKAVESTAAFLARRGVRARPYHAGLSDAERIATQESFRRDDIDVIVATIAFGMGIDKSNVRFVIHRDMPKDVESWYQEIGRSGRDGLPAECVVFHSWADVKLHERFLRDIEDPGLRRDKQRGTVKLFELLESSGCRHRAILGHFDEAIGDCGDACDVCLGVSGAQLAARAIERTGTGKRGGPSAARLPGDLLRPAPDGGLGVSAASRDPETARLFEVLRALRRRLADERGVPAYVVFSDRSLLEMAARLPGTPEEMLSIAGVGPAKLERYGDQFLAAIAAGGSA